MTLRDEIESELDDRNMGFDSIDKDIKSEILDAILALVEKHKKPTGIVAVRECKVCIDGPDCSDGCSSCFGTGRIERELTQEEVMEEYKRIIESVNETGSYGYPKSLINLPSGERVEVKK